MEKINFVNETAPALNATNLNKMQDNMENAINDVNDAIPEILEKIKKPEKVRLFKGTCNIGNTVELSEEPDNFRIIFFRIGSSVTFPMCIQSPGNSTVLRASQGFTYGNSIEIFAVNGTISGKNFTLVATNQIEIKASGNIVVADKQAVTEVWGIR